jgi:hypothetical protein
MTTLAALSNATLATFAAGFALYAISPLLLITVGLVLLPVIFMSVEI